MRPGKQPLDTQVDRQIRNYFSYLYDSYAAWGWVIVAVIGVAVVVSILSSR